MHLIERSLSSQVTVDDILNHFERRRRIAQAQCSRDQTRQIHDVSDYFEALNDTFERHSRRHCFKVDHEFRDWIIGGWEVQPHNSFSIAPLNSQK